VSSKRWWYVAGSIGLIALVWLGNAQLNLYAANASGALRLAVLLLWTKTVADVLESPVRSKRSTFYYEDYFAEWVHYGALSVIAILCVAIAEAVIAVTLARPPVALGVYIIWRVTSPHRGGSA
jgi:hypothetical protein